MDNFILDNDVINEMKNQKYIYVQGCNCLSNIVEPTGTKPYRHINFFHQSRISILLGYAIITVLLFSQNSAARVTLTFKCRINQSQTSLSPD